MNTRADELWRLIRFTKDATPKQITEWCKELNQILSQEGEMKCTRCSCSNTKENPVTKAPDPYASEIHDDDTDVWECASCREQSALDI